MKRTKKSKKSKKLTITQKKVITILILLGLFVAGWYANEVLSTDKEMPYFSSSEDKLSPQDYITEDQIWIQKNRVVINVKDASWARYTDTNSMDPLLDIGANGIEIIPVCEEILPGDVIVYEPRFIDGLIVHRVIEKNIDEDGLYFKLKGDNARNPDPEKVRCDQIKYQLIAVIY